MLGTKKGIAIVNRNFWPKSQILGEALLRLSEEMAETEPVCVITQADGSLRDLLDKEGRGNGVEVRDCKSRTTSSSGVLKRALEALAFMVWTFISLIRFRPERIYVATDPPVIVPFIVFLYSKIFGSKYYYHLQDIHPEAANIVIKVNGFLYEFLKALDNVTVRNCAAIITLSEDMRSYIEERSGLDKPVFIMDNPSFEVSYKDPDSRAGDIVFCGNAGRLQRIPLLISAIEEYIEKGGNLKFTFIGSGIFSQDIAELSNKFRNVSYLGYLPAPKAADVVKNHHWALLPIEDEVTRYAFPSKSSSYVQSRCALIAVCSESTSVARWVDANQLGLTCEPRREALVSCFFNLESDDAGKYRANPELLKRLKIGVFVAGLAKIISYA